MSENKTIFFFYNCFSCNCEQMTILFVLKKIKNPKPIKEIIKLIILIMTSAQDIKLGINDQLRLMTQCRESLNSKKMPCTLIVFGLLKVGCRNCRKKADFQTQGEWIWTENRGILLSASFCSPSIAKNPIILDESSVSVRM